ncbi:MAG: methyl-accepting chemotaxis protein, partial [Burkholderiaceae bacterium]|nr:methyl-accepting chemotaxis protein [Burkholderiaceae bacterium]
MALDIPFFSKKNKDLPSAEAGSSESSPNDTPALVTDYSALQNVHVPGITKEKAFDIRLPLIGHRTRQWQERFLMTVLFFSIVFGIVFALAQWQRNYLNVYQTRITTDLQQQLQNINAATANAIQAKPEAVDQLESSYNQFNKGFGYIQELLSGRAGAVEAGGGRSAYEATPEMLEAGKKIGQIWATPEAAIQSILSMRDELTAYSSSMQKIESHATNGRKLAEQIATAISKGNASSQDANSANQLRALTLRLERDKNELLTSEGLNVERALALGKDVSSARSLAEGLLSSNLIERISPEDQSLRNNLTKLQETLSQYQQALRAMTGHQENVLATKQAHQRILAVNENLKDALNGLKNLYFEESQKTGGFTWLMLGCVGIALVALALFMIVQIQGSIDDTIEAEKRREESEQQRLEAIRLEEEARELNERNQAAILRLMNELQEVADGDLTTQATVSEDITGAIADSINYTVEELRGLVGRVTTTAEQVDTASAQAQEMSSTLINASQQQSREIEEATQLVLRMAQDITNVSKSANESAEVARQSLMVASQGASAVENTIKGMNEIREQIQETAKRIKRLGESS